MTEALLGFGAVFVLALLRMPLAFAMGLVGFVGLGLMRGWPATAASAAPITKVRLMVRSVSMPSRLAIFLSCSQARIARPSGVRVTSQVKTASTPSVTAMISICI